MIIDEILKNELISLAASAYESGLTIDEYIGLVKHLKKRYESYEKFEDELRTLRKNSADKNEYQKITYQITKQSKPEVKLFNIGDTSAEFITFKTFYINIMKYSKIPAKQYQEYYMDYVIPLAGLEYFHLGMVTSLLSLACNSHYNEEQLLKMLKENEFNIFEKPAECMRAISVSSTKSLVLRIKKYNESFEDKIVPFYFYVDGIDKSPKTLYLRSDMIKLEKFLEVKEGQQ